MKTIDVSERVMKKVAGFERKRTTLWLRSFIIITVSLTIAFGAVFSFVIRDLLEKRAFDFFELFTQDPEIIAEFWKDALSTFWDELPQELLFIAVITLIVFLIFIIV